MMQSECLCPLIPGDARPLIFERELFGTVSDEESPAIVACRAALVTHSGQSTIRQLRATASQADAVTITRLYQILRSEPGMVCGEDGTVLGT